MKRLGLVALILATACSSGNRAAGCGASGRAGADSFCVALLTPGPISDQSWNGGAYQGLMAIRDSRAANGSRGQTSVGRRNVRGQYILHQSGGRNAMRRNLEAPIPLTPISHTCMSSPVGTRTAMRRRSARSNNVRSARSASDMNPVHQMTA